MCENAQNVQVHIYDCMYEHEKAEKPIHDKAAMSLRGKWALIHIGFSLQSLIFGSVDKDLIF
jgi:hydrogenase maturation factor